MSTSGEIDDRGLPRGHPLDPRHEISPREASARLASGKPYLVLDCRLKEEHEVARLEHSLPVPLHELESRLDEVAEELERRGCDRADGFAVLCHHGVRSLKAALLLQASGFPGARSIAGGIEAWSLGVDPSVPRYTRQGSRCTLVPNDAGNR